MKTPKHFLLYPERERRRRRRRERERERELDVDSWLMASCVSHQPWTCRLQNSFEEEETSSVVLLWKEYFGDPSQWWDNRHRKVHPGYPDFKHKGTRQCLWVDRGRTPSWVLEELNRRAAQACDGELQAKDAFNECTAFVVLLRACAKTKDLSRGSLAHDDIVRKGLLAQCSDALVTMYAKCGALVKAQELLDMVGSSNVYTWTALITAYALHDQGVDALKCFERMECEGLSPDAVTFACILKSCGSIRALDKGRRIHDEITRHGLLKDDIVLGNALVDMYVKCGALEKARHMLQALPRRDVVSWNTLISGYAEQGQGEQALKCFEQMQQEGLCATSVTYTCILKACGSIKAVDKGEEIHDEIAKQGLLEHSIVLGTALLDMYAKCGALSKAQQVLQSLRSRDVVSWNALIAGYAQQGQGERALECFAHMQKEGISPSPVTFSSVFDACGSIGAIDEGEKCYREIIRRGFLENNVALATAVVDMYVNCGNFMKAQQVLEELSLQSAPPWNAIITGYAKQGQSDQALKRFNQMIWKGISPDAVTFSGVLNACSHLGLMDDAHMHFLNMSRTYGVKPDLGHFTGMVDLFGRAGHLDKALEVIQEMPPCNDRAVWSTLLGACQKWGDVDVARRAFEHVVKSDKSDSASYVLMANMFAAAGLDEDVGKVAVLRNESRA